MKRTNGTHGSTQEVATTSRRPGMEEVTAPKSKRGRPAGGKKDLSTIDVGKLMVKPSVMTITIAGLTPLLVHNFGSKAIKQILDKQTGEAKPGPRAKKDPFEDFKESLYVMNPKKLPKNRLSVGQHWGYLPDTFGFPESAFKKAMVQACSFVEGVPKTWIRGLVHIYGGENGLLPIKYSKVVMRQDTVRIGNFGSKTADIRFRAEFHDWSVKLLIRYNRSAITPEQIAMLINNAGFAVGVGEWRPEKDGSHGTFAIE